jgi:hypothetical protein
MGETSLHFACKRGDLSILRALTTTKKNTYSCDINAKNNKNESAWDVAQQFKHKHFIPLLNGKEIGKLVY